MSARYPEKVWKFFREPKRAGRFADGRGVRTGRATTPASHAQLQLQLRMSADGRIEEALFQALGCPYLIATGAWLCAHVTGRRGESVRDLDGNAIVEQLQLPAVKRYCAVMAREALEAALDAPADTTPASAGTGSDDD